MSEPYDSAPETREHINRVYQLLSRAAHKLALRAMVHDASKLEEPEKSMFDEYTPKLRALSYGSPEYEVVRQEMLATALAHHYSHNSHHPEHYSNGIDGMSALDVLEMLVDWKAASERHADGNFAKSLEINRARFGISFQYYYALINTARELEWITAADALALAHTASDETREALAAYAHEAWSGWMRYLFEKSTRNDNGTVTIPAWAVERWERQVATPYADLPEQERESDRAEADRMLAVVRGGNA